MSHFLFPWFTRAISGDLSTATYPQPGLAVLRRNTPRVPAFFYLKSRAPCYKNGMTPEIACQSHGPALYLFEREITQGAIVPEQQKVEEFAEYKEGAKVRCGQCGHAITDLQQTYYFADRCQFTFTNPLGIVFDILLFKHAQGGESPGDAVRQHSWFPPYAWRCTYCEECHYHLGWMFENNQSVFFALILDRIRFDMGELRQQ